MDDNIVKICVVCHTGKSIDNFHTKYRECKACNIEGVLKRYYNNKETILQQRWDKWARFEDLDNRFKALEEKLRVNINLT